MPEFECYYGYDDAEYILDTAKKGMLKHLNLQRLHRKHTT